MIYKTALEGSTGSVCNSHETASTVADHERVIEAIHVEDQLPRWRVEGIEELLDPQFT